QPDARPTPTATERNRATDRCSGRCSTLPLSDRPERPGGVAQGLVRRRLKTRSDSPAEHGTALVWSMMELIVLTQSSPDARRAGRTPVGLRLLKPKHTRPGKEESARLPSNYFAWFLSGRLLALLGRELWPARPNNGATSRAHSMKRSTKGLVVRF